MSMGNDSRVHFKMFKKGKVWMFAGLTIILGVMGQGLITDVHADTSNEVVQASNVVATKATNQSMHSVAPRTATSVVANTSLAVSSSNDNTNATKNITSNASSAVNNSEDKAQNVAELSSAVNKATSSATVKIADSTGDLSNQNSVASNAASSASTSNIQVDNSIVSSGTYGTANWDLNNQGGLTIYSGTLGTGPTGKWTDTTANPIKTITINNGVVANANSIELFGGLTSLTTIINANNLNMSNVTAADNMLSNNNKLQYIDVSNWDTHNITDMNSMFNYDFALTGLDVSNWDTSNVIDFRNMFIYDGSLTNLDVYWDTSKVVDMSSVFQFMSNLQSIDVSRWNTSQVTVFTNIFNGDQKLTSLDISGWDTREASNTSLATMFLNTSDLQKMTLGPDDVNLENSGLSNPIIGQVSTVGPTTLISTGYWQSVNPDAGGSLQNPKGDTMTGLQVVSTPVSQKTTYVAQNKIVATVHFVDANGNTLIPDVTITGFADSPLDYTSPVINGYTILDDSTVGSNFLMGSSNNFTVVYQADAQ